MHKPVSASGRTDRISLRLNPSEGSGKKNSWVGDSKPWGNLGGIALEFPQNTTANHNIN